MSVRELAAWVGDILFVVTCIAGLIVFAWVLA